MMVADIFTQLPTVLVCLECFSEDAFFEVSPEESDVTQFNQLNLNSSFPIWLLIN